MSDTFGPMPRRRLLTAAGAGLALAALPGVRSARAAAPDPQDWDTVLNAARGQTVYWTAWGGDDKINRHIDWIGKQVRDRFGVTLRHVKVADIADVIARLLAEKAAGRTEGGQVDLMWINGENFLTAKDAGLLYGPFATALPNWRYVDVAGKPTVTVDFTVPTDGLESPWGMSQFTLAYDSARMPEPPRSLRALGDWARAHPGRITYPAPPDFLGSTFLKQALHDLTADPAVLARPVETAAFSAATAPVWAWLAAVRPSLWREGREYPRSGPDQRRLLADGEVDIYFSFHPSDASSAIAQGLVPPSVRTVMFEGGMIGNTHFVAIPATATAKAGALVVADFLLSPDAQVEKQHPDVWGDDTVLAMDALSSADRARFDALPLGPATLPLDARAPALPEPHPSWMTALEAEWQRIHTGG
ncbi:ABC transporter substrate-binding protein [Roseospira goensis]|uniref:Putative thiamine transport system substrate-binding protein n=1 Tax=Roseospira goensis TaxID=391922 RepID=A0A7W6S2M0_9PROT|nr:ABC transporter substrate-binding protein [Roseospira goensis]MBB4287049.1 putative thiamine transport system substrate-binding protein [Roseospira goensis]